MKCKINALLRTKSPLHVAAPDNKRFNEKTGKVYIGSEGGMACTGIQELPFIDAEEDNGQARIPAIAANNIAGRLRRHAAQHVLNVIVGKGEAVTLSTFSMLMSGAVTGNPSAEDISYAEYKVARNHPYFGLLGGGPKMMRRSVRISPAIPVTVKTLKAGLLQHPYANEDMAMAMPYLKGVWAFRRNDDLRDLTHVDLMEKGIENFQEEFESRQMKIIKEQKDAKEGKKVKSKTSTFTYSAMEFVYPGVIFDLAFEFDVNDFSQLGLFLLSLDSFAANERLGGHSRNGFGRFALENLIISPVEGDFEFGFDAQDIFNDGRLDKENPVVAKALAAWEEAALELDAESLNAFSAAGIKKEAKKKAKK